MSLFATYIFVTVTFICTFFFALIVYALRRLQKRTSLLCFKKLGRFFVYHPVAQSLFPDREFESIYITAVSIHNIFRFLLAGAVVLLLIQENLLPLHFTTDGSLTFTLPRDFGDAIGILSIIACAIGLGDLLPRFLGGYYPQPSLIISAPFCGLVFLLCLPITFLVSRFSGRLFHLGKLLPSEKPSDIVKKKIIEIIHEAGEEEALDPTERKLIESVVTFRDRIVREIMVPRVDIFSLPADTSIREAARQLETKGYSRIPIYRNSVDNIEGVLMYKDIIAKYMDYEEYGHDSKILEAPVQTIAKNVLYTPETKKISLLLQEFRKKQVHLAIVVDEYGGTEGIVTIEDILEEIVGEIADEYDEQESLFQILPGGSWIVDARMTISDVEEQLGIEIPQEGDYDSIGGYIFHSTGTIPSKGFVIKHDDFEIRILSSNERCVEKIKLTPHTRRDTKTSDEHH